MAYEDLFGTGDYGMSVPEYGADYGADYGMSTPEQFASLEPTPAEAPASNWVYNVPGIDYRDPNLGFMTQPMAYPEQYQAAMQQPDPNLGFFTQPMDFPEQYQAAMGSPLGAWEGAELPEAQQSMLERLLSPVARQWQTDPLKVALPAAASVLGLLQGMEQKKAAEKQQKELRRQLQKQERREEEAQKRWEQYSRPLDIRWTDRRYTPTAGDLTRYGLPGGPVERQMFSPMQMRDVVRAKKGGPLSRLQGGQSDQVPAMLSPGEYVMDADTVSALGDGDTDSGVYALDRMREEIRRHKRAASSRSIPPKAKPASKYMTQAKRKAKAKTKE